MGVTTFLLDRRKAGLLIGGILQQVGTLRTFYKLTELGRDRRAERDAASRTAWSPAAVLVMDITDLPLAERPDEMVAAHLVLGWDEGRGSVTDFGWEYLPRLGYAVRNSATGYYELFELRDELLHSINEDRALALGLIDQDRRLVRKGQPVIVGCDNVRPFLDKYVDADCTLSNGNVETLMTTIRGGGLPPAEWFLGKTPREVETYPSS